MEMTKLLEHIIEEAKKLPPAEQDALAQRWMADVQSDEELPQWLREELDHRLQEIERNPDACVPWEVVREQLRQRFGS